MILAHGNNLNHGLTNYYKFDGDSTDLVGGNNGTDTDMSYTSGKLNSGASFNGTSSKITLDNDITSPLNTERSFSFWLYGISTGHGFGGFLNKSAPSTNLGFYIYTNSTYHSVFWGGGSVGSIATFPSNEWSHIVFTFGATGIIRSYVNGILFNSDGRHDTYDLTYNTFGYFAWYDTYLDTKIDEFGVWNRELSQNDVDRLYNNGKALDLSRFDNSLPKILTNSYKPDTNGLVLFLDATNPNSYSGTGLNWYDLSPQGNHAALDTTHPPIFDPVTKRFQFTVAGSTKAVIPNSASLNFGTGDFTILHFSEHPVGGDIIGCVLSKGAVFDTNRAGWLITAHAGYNLYQVISDGTQRTEMWFPAPGSHMFPLGFYGLIRRGGLLYHVYDGVVSVIFPTNGSQSTDYSMDVSSSDNVSIGFNPPYNYYWNGNISNVIIYNRGISDEEVSTINAQARSFNRVVLRNTGSAKGPVAVWKFEGNSNDVFGVYNGTDTNISYVSGKNGQAASFNGASEITYGPVPFTNRTNFTVCCWIKPNDANAYEFLISKWDYGSAGVFGLAKTSGGQLLGFLCGTAGDNGSNFVQTTNGTITTGWHHVAMVYDGNLADPADRVKIYQDGILLNVAVNGSISNVNTGVSGTFSLGKLHPVGLSYSGLIDEVFVFNESLSAADVLKLSNV